MEAKDSKRAIRTFNRLAQTLLEYQHLWHGAWLRSVEASKAQLQATLLAEHLQTGEGPRCWGRGYAGRQAGWGCLFCGWIQQVPQKRI